MSSIREVRKRDCRVVPFDGKKIADAIQRAMRSVGQGDASLAADLAAAVVEDLERDFARRIPDIESIQDVVETVLMAKGQPRVAKAYILFRQKRALMRETLQVRKVCGKVARDDTAVEDDADAEDFGADRYPRVDEVERGNSRWCRGKITAALIREAELTREPAEEIAAAVERRVLKSGIVRISTALIRELVDNELFERGLNAKLERQAPVGLPKYNLEQVLFGGDSKGDFPRPENPSEVRETIANRILHQYSLQEVFSATLAEAHRDGRVFLHRLTDPVRVASVCWDVTAELDALEAGLPVPDGRRPEGRGSSSRSWSDDDVDDRFAPFTDLFGRLTQIEPFVSEEIRLAGLTDLLDTAARGFPGPASVTREELARAALERLAQCEMRPRLVLDLDLGASSHPWLKGFLQLPLAQSRRLVVSLRLPAGECGADEKEVRWLVAQLYSRGDRLEFVCNASPPVAKGSVAARRDPGARLRSAVRSISAQGSLRGRSGGSGISAVLSKITLNLPRVAYRARRNRFGSIECEIEAAVDLAVKGHLERRHFLSRLAASHESPLWGFLGRSMDGAAVEPESDARCVVGLLGLSECVKCLTGHEPYRSQEASRLGRDIVRRIHRKLRREQRAHGMRFDLEETLNRGPLGGLERRDCEQYPEFFAASPDPGGAVEASPEAEPRLHAGDETLSRYTDGVRVHRAAPFDALRRLEELAPYLPFLTPAAGVIEDVPELRGSHGELFLSLLEEAIALLDPERVGSRRGGVLVAD